MGANDVVVLVSVDIVVEISVATSVIVVVVDSVRVVEASIGTEVMVVGSTVVDVYSISQ